MLSLFLLACNKETKPICIGFSANLTGSGSDLGVSGMYGAMLAVSEINQEDQLNGRQLYLNIKNDKANPDNALNADTELIEEGCNIIVGHMISSVMSTVIPLINDTNTLMVSPTISTESLSGINDNFIRLIPSNIKQIESLATIIDFNRLKHFGILYDSNNALFASTFIEWLDQKSNNQVSNINNIITFNSNNEVDYNAIINELQDKEIEELLFISSGDIVAKIAQHLKIQDIQLKVFLPTWALSDALIMRGGNAVEGFVGINFYDINHQSDEYLNFKNGLNEKYNISPTFSSIMAYEAVFLIAEAINSTDSVDPMILKEHIVSANTYNGIFNDIIIDAYGDVNRSIELYKVVNGEFSGYIHNE